MCAVCVFAVTSLGGLPEAAAGDATAALRAVGDAQVSKGQPISVVAEEFTDVNTRLQDVIEQALAARGYDVQPQAALVLSFDTEMSSQTDPEAGVRGDPDEQEVLDQESDPIGDTSDLGREDPLTPAPQIQDSFGGEPPLEGTQYSLTFVLGREDAPAIWQGDVTAVLPASDPFDVASGMVPVLADHIGQAVRKQGVQISF